MKPVTAVLVGALALAGAASAHAGAQVGATAPDFTLTDSKGGQHSLSALRGKWVVLEWVNYDCPFVKKHYGSGNLPGLQKAYTAKGVVWLAINSSAPGKQGSFPPAEIESRSRANGAAFRAYLVDADGTVGRAYGAKTTPHMFVIDPKGILVYAGGIDDIATTDVEDLKTAKNYVRLALDEAMAGRKVSTSSSTPYGCSVKY